MSVEQPPTPPLAPPGGSGGWTITKSEWDGCGAVNNSVTKFSWIAQAILMLFGLGALAYAIWRAPAVFTPYLIGAIALFLIAVIAQGLWTRRAVRRWARLIPVVWESNGCVCPYCRTRVDETPCTRHGLSATEAPLLRDYWQAMATRDLAGTQRALQALLNAARRRSMFVRLTGPLSALWRKSITASNDSTLSAWGRLRGSLPFIGVELVVLVAGGLALQAIFGWNILIGILSGCWWIIPMLLVSPMVGPMFRTSRLRCAKCKQLCASAQPTLCAECGADLTKPAALARFEFAGRWRVGIVLLPMCLILLLPLIRSPLMSVLPQSMRMTLYHWTAPPANFFQLINVATITPAEAVEAADLLIAQAAPGGKRPLFDFDFLTKALALNKLPPSYREKAARVVVQATLSFEPAGAGVRDKVTITPSLGEPIFGRNAMPRLVFGGISIDGGAWVGGAAWSLFEHDVNLIWRSIDTQLPVLREDKLHFEHALETALAPGVHELRARCWIVLWGPAYQRYEPAFDESGALLAPADAEATYELNLSKSIDSR